MKLLDIKESDKAGKKFTVVVEHEGRRKTIHFGSAGSDDYTISGSKQKRAAYLARHMVNENWENPLTAGFWSRWLLWNKRTLEASLRDVMRRFQLE
jgi:hypothetical protein